MFNQASRYTIFLLAACFLSTAAGAQATFDVASIHLSGSSVQGERNGTTEASFGTLKMRDVTVYTCIHWAYGTPLPLIHGPSNLKNIHYDITAKTSRETTEDQIRLMLRALLTERFKFTFHKEKAELPVYTLTVAKGGIKMKPAADPAVPPSHANGNMDMVAHSMTMTDLADYLADPLNSPLVDKTGLTGRYDFTINFTPYVDAERTSERPDPAAVLKSAIKGELGLDVTPSKQTVDILAIDHVEPPSSN